jgi:hypothetical protein
VARQAPQSLRRARTVPRAGWIGLAVVAVLIGTMGVISFLGSRGTVDVNLGDREAGPYNATVMARQIARDGPLLLPDASPHRTLDVYLQHLGVNPTVGWLAFSARAPGSDDRRCTLTWADGAFGDPCGGGTFPADGAGLRQFTVRVAANAVYVDLGAAVTP